MSLFFFHPFYIYIYVCVCAIKFSLYHCVTLLTYFQPLFFSFWTFLLPILPKKKKILIFSLLVHIYCYTSSNLSPPSLPFYLPITLYFTIKLFSSFPFSFILIFLLPILFYINLISFLLFNSFFFHKKTLSTLSLSLSLSLYVWIFFSFL